MAAYNHPRHYNYIRPFESRVNSDTTVSIGQDSSVPTANGVIHGSQLTYQNLQEANSQTASEIAARHAQIADDAREVARLLREERERNPSQLEAYSRYIRDEMLDVMRMTPAPTITIPVDHSDITMTTLAGQTVTLPHSPITGTAPSIGLGTVTTSELYPTTRVSTSQYIEKALKEKSLANEFKARITLNDGDLRTLAESLRINTSLNLFGKTLEVSTKLEMALSTGEVITCDVSTDSIDIGDLND